jgi:hypothetical protein
MLPTCGNDIPYPVAFPPKPFTLVDALAILSVKPL